MGHSGPVEGGQEEQLRLTIHFIVKSSLEEVEKQKT